MSHGHPWFPILGHSRVPTLGQSRGPSLGDFRGPRLGDPRGPRLKQGWRGGQEPPWAGLLELLPPGTRPTDALMPCCPPLAG
jgi:hypothetical protein